MKLLLLFFLSTSAWADFFPAAFKANLEESHISPVSRKLKKQKGTIAYKFPGLIKMDMGKIIFVSNNKKSWIYTPPRVPGAKGEVVIKPSGDFLLLKFFDSLKRELKSNDLFKVAQMDNTYTLSFSKKAQKEIGASVAKLYFNKSKPLFENLDRMVVTKLNKQDITYKFSSLDKSPKLGKKDFVFEIPPQTNVSY